MAQAKKPYLSVIVPVYNEAKRLPLTLVDIDRHLSEAEYEYEILVVNDGSIDDTVVVVEQMAKMIPNVQLTGYEHNRGKGAAVRHGMLEAKGKYRLFMDSDNSTSIDHFENMVPFLREGYDVVICSRDLKESRMEPPQTLIKRILGNAGNLFVQLLLIRGIWDTQCGFKCFSESAAKEIFPLVRVERWGFDIEALALAKKLGYKIKQIPVLWVNDADSRVKPSAYIQTLIDAVKIRWWLWRDVYGIRK